jgi:spore germination cell wall hydrolase CwlJ-like protein
MRLQGLLGLALGAAIIFGAGEVRATYAPLDDDGPAFETGASDRDIVYETRLYCLSLAVYFEGGSTAETEEGQRHIARVVVERARANKPMWGGPEICDVVFHKSHGVCQFSFACLPVARRTPRGGAAWRYSVEIARDEIEGRSNVEERSIRYYMNAALSARHNVCAFRKEFVRVGQVGRHEFFREPSSEELVQLRRSQPAACVSHKASKSKKRFAKSGKHKRVAAKAKSKKIKFARRGN